MFHIFIEIAVLFALQTCPLCSGQLLGLNTALMRVAEIMFGDSQHQAVAGEETDSLDFTLQQEVGDEVELKTILREV